MPIYDGIGIFSDNQMYGKSINFASQTPGYFNFPSNSPFSFSRATTCTAQTSNSTIIRGVPANQAVINQYGLQIEPSGINYILNSDNISSWGGFSANAINNGSVTDPAGGNYGFDISTNPGSYIYSNTANGANTSYIYSCFLNQATGANRAAYAWYSPFILRYDEQPVSSGWHRTSASYAGSSQTCSVPDIGYNTSFATRSLYAFPQCEVGSVLPYPSSYIPTTTTAVTRAESYLLMALPSNKLTKFTLRVDFIAAWGTASGGLGIGINFIVSSDISNFVQYVQSGSGGCWVLHTPGGSVTTTNTATWNAGDLVSLRMQLTNSTNVYFKTVVNNVVQTNEILVGAAIPTFSTTGNYVASFSNLEPRCKGITYVSLS